MKRSFGISLITLSISILLLHSFVPHHHSENGFNLDEILRNEPVKSPLDLLKVGFHINLGANHLENFQKSKSVIAEKKAVAKEQLKAQGLIPNSLKLNLAKTTENQSLFPPRTIGAIQIQFNNSFTYRGPPLFA
ncbi:hypothetical protein MATR_15500 [Marivirga tractuosa]|uniref:Uncharacterized protein n=1 Tax=Marivirga tractuosa (strain ATCC 23168 / DSM 4126 / NBRC 15989 / NCIMB 1408 / VKM B-1430 / H-43) TaxID=643867 RepID=E4TSK4_MARTH|nr:hypothetical protein [Marivirga tractuosa]ADR20824.1 hypothetical protein Ftrac_0822 [Marivirga tractuosa DSM 4126]BDD14725.1 hypothetical protein MATR_15500 [Marivirga tractuosa]